MCFDFILFIGRNIIRNKVKFAIVLLQVTNKTMLDNNEACFPVPVFVYDTKFTVRNTCELKQSNKYFRYLIEGWAAKSGRFTRNVKSHLPSLVAIWKLLADIPSPFADGNGTRFQLHHRHYTNYTGLFPEIPLRKSKNNNPPVTGDQLP